MRILMEVFQNTRAPEICLYVCCFPTFPIMSDASAACCPTVFDKRRFEGTASFYTMHHHHFLRLLSIVTNLNDHDKKRTED